MNITIYFIKIKKNLYLKNIHELLTARGLAYWIMNDGSKYAYNQSILHTRAFNKEEVLLLQNALTVYFNMTSRMEEKIKINE
jgi:hypothetical protein